MTPRTRRIALLAGAPVGVLVALFAAALLTWPRINDVSTMGTPQYPDVKPQRFNVPANLVYAAAHAVAKDMQFEITGQSMREIRAVATTPVLGFKDDVTISLLERRGEVVVDVRSRSRVGQGDFGTNARRIREFQRRLDEKVAAAALARK